MLYHFLVPLAQYHIVFNLFRYQTFRAAGAVVTAFLVAFYFGPAVIRRLRMLKVGQVVRTEGPQTHLGKSGTPTMGGVLIVLATVIPTLLWADLTNPYTITAIIVLVWLGALGFMDDYLKVVRKKTEGLIGRYKIVGQVSIGMLLDFQFVIDNLALVVGAALIVYILKSVVTAGTVVALGYPVRIAAIAGMALAQICETSFVLERVGAAAGMSPLGMGYTGEQAFIAVTVLLMLATPFSMQAGPKVGALLPLIHWPERSIWSSRSDTSLTTQ